SAVSIVDESLQEAGAWLASATASAEAATDETVSLDVFTVSIEDETSAENQLCSALFNGVTAVLDLTAGGWEYGRTTATRLAVPYVHGQISIAQHVAAVDSLLETRNATDAALIFSGEDELDQALYYLVEGSSVRVIVLVGLDQNSTSSLRRMRPAPAYYVLFGTGRECALLFDQAVQQGFVTRDSRWTVAITGTDPENFRSQSVPSATTVTVMSPDPENCCVAQNLQPGCDCNQVNMPEQLTSNLVLILTKALKASGAGDVKGECSALPQQAPPTQAFVSAFKKELSSWSGAVWKEESHKVSFSTSFHYTAVTGTKRTSIGSWSSDAGITLEPLFQHTPIKRFFRVGSVESRPWFYEDSDPDGITYEGYKGYCVELALRLAAMMEFDFTFVSPQDGKFGAKTTNGSWNGLVADLANGETDLIVAPLTMTSEREEVIDFVTPYFDQSGISIG
ncbi:Ionotropic glutamate receptor L-glutamate and glycine-binding domain, partial [Trinorchestia longiramus]